MLLHDSESDLADLRKQLADLKKQQTVCVLCYTLACTQTSSATCSLRLWLPPVHHRKDVIAKTCQLKVALGTVACIIELRLRFSG